MKKRLLSALLTFCMVLTLLPVSAFAAPEGQSDPLQPSAKYYEFGSTGETGEQNADITLSKIAEDNGDGTYDVTLTAKANQVVTAKATEVVFVIDGSNSMYWCDQKPRNGNIGWVNKDDDHYHGNDNGVYCTLVERDEKDSRWDIALNAIETMQENLGNAGVSYKYVVYRGDNQTGPWSDHDSPVITTYDTFADLEASSPLGGTHLRAGIDRALGVFGLGDTNKVMIVVADGDSDDGYPADEETTGSFWDPETKPTEFGSFKKDGGEVYTVGFTFSSEDFNDISSGEGYSFTATNAEELNLRMEQISENIKGLISDPLGAGVELVDGTLEVTTADQPAATVTGNTINWTNAEDGLAGEVTLTYTVKIKDEAVQAGHNEIPLNGQATLNYQYTGGYEEVAFPVPTAVFDAATLSVSYQDAEGNLIEVVNPIADEWVKIGEGAKFTANLPQVNTTLTGTDGTPYYVQSVSGAPGDVLEAKEYNVTVTLSKTPVQNPVGSPITIQVIADGNTSAPIAGATVDTYINVYPYQSSVGEGYTGDSWDAGTYTDGQVTYSKTFYDCKDIGFAAKDGYVIEAIDADLVFGQSGCTGITETSDGQYGDYKADNVKGGSMVTVYVRTAYHVDYYNGETLLTNTPYNDTTDYVAATTQLTAHTTLPTNPTGDGYSHVACDCPNQDTCEHKGYTNESGGQEEANYIHVIDLNTTVTLPSLPSAEPGTTVNGWNLGSTNGTLVTAGTEYTPGEEADKADGTDDNIIEFYSNTTVNTYTITINYEDEAGNVLQDAHSDTKNENAFYLYTVGTDPLPMTITGSDNMQYVYDQLAKDSDALRGTVTGPVTITAIYSVDANKDEVPDKYQATVNYTVEGGTWGSSYNNQDTVTQVYNYREFDEETQSWKQVGTPVLKDIPDVNTVVPDDEHIKAGAWDDTAPVEGDAVPAAGQSVTYTYRLTATAPSVSITKTATPTEGVTVDDPIQYTIKVKNDGNVALTNVVVTDTKWTSGTQIKVSGVTEPVTLDGNSYTIDELAEEAEVTITYSYTTQQADVADGVTNTATVKAKEIPDGEEVTTEPIPVQEPLKKIIVNFNRNWDDSWAWEGTSAGDEQAASVSFTLYSNTIDSQDVPKATVNLATQDFAGWVSTDSLINLGLGGTFSYESLSPYVSFEGAWEDPADGALTAYITFNPVLTDTDPDAGKTLKIYWAINNKDGAEWSDVGNSDDRTELYSWKDRENELGILGLTVKEGYKLAGWTVNGETGEYWDANTETFKLNGNYVEDAEGGYLSITANIVVDEPTDPDAGKTLKIYWAINNKDGAEWSDVGNSDDRTELYSWKDRENELGILGLTVKEGYKLAGWTVNGETGEYWDANTETFKLNGNYVEDAEGGYLSITANIVVDEPTDPDAGKTLKIYWAINNKDGAEWSDVGNSDDRTELYSWKDRENELGILGLTVKEGYKLAGWTVNGETGEYWDANTETFKLSGNYVEDAEGGYLSITANIVVDEPADPDAGKTLKIYWAINNKDGAEWSDVGNSDDRTELYSWKDRENELGILGLTVKEGYKLAGWTVNGETGEYWDANTETFKLNGNYVEDAEGGYLSITANIVVDEPTDPDAGKTLKIYWAINNKDGAEWSDVGNSDDRTELYSWKDRENELGILGLTVKEGYKLAGWTVNGETGEYWDANTETFKLNGNYVEDAEGGYLSITANIVVDEPTDPDAGKTLKIYWAIDNKDGAEWSDVGNSDDRTELYSWKDRENELGILGLTVKEGYKLAGWTVNGETGEYWDANTETFKLNGNYVEDAEGGYLSITANIVVDEPTDPDAGKTLKIYWAIDNKDGAEWSDVGNSDDRTELYSWKDRENELGILGLTVKEGYKLAGWTVNGETGEYWDANTETFKLNGNYVEDAEGGYLSITANIVVDEPTDPDAGKTLKIYWAIDNKDGAEWSDVGNSDDRTELYSWKDRENELGILGLTVKEGYKLAGWTVNGETGEYWDANTETFKLNGNYVEDAEGGYLSITANIVVDEPTDPDAGKTLKIYWAIDNKDGAEWSDVGNSDDRTELYSWKDRENELGILGLTVKEGYKLAGWTVNGKTGEYWDANTETFKLNGNYVEDAEGGYLSITANIVVDEPTDPDAGKTLKIYWSIDNKDGAEWSDVGNSDDRTELYSWKDRENELGILGLTVKEGYKLAGWTVNGETGEYWDANTETFKLNGNYVEDAEGGYLSITANIVVDEPTDPDAGKTLKIYWSIDNKDGAEWSDVGNSDDRTELYSWKDRENELGILGLTVKEGYKLAGWTVNGKTGEYWDANTETFKLNGNYVEDAEGGYLSITANIVVDEPTDPDAGKTLKIYWAIDNKDGAEWSDVGNSDDRTELYSWKDRENELGILGLTVKEGYKLAGWTVNGKTGEYWDANTETFKLNGNYVEDAEGGYLSITANIVVDEPTDPDAGKTLKIYWAIDNKDGAEWSDVGNSDDRTELYSWKDRENELGILGLTVKEGYKLAGWTVNGETGEYWDANTETFKLNGNYVEDAEGGYLSITANIVADDTPVEPADPFTLTYDANGGNQSNVPVDNRAYHQGNTAYLENDTDELDDELGHRGDDVVFVGWSRNDQYSMNNPATREPNTITSVAFVNSDITVYAVWAEDDNNNGIPDYDEEVPEQPEDPDDEEEDENTSDPTYAVYYYPGYGNGARDLDKRYEEDTEVEVLAFEDVDLTDREGYIFIGWSTQANADIVIYLPGDTFDMPDHDVHLYAQWIREQIGPEDTGVANWLNTTDHIAYLTGYPGGTFGPNNSMTRAEVAQMFYALLNNKNVTITASFPDVPADAWYATAVNTLASLGMVSGDADGNFRPNDPITRAEFCVIALAFAYEPESYSCSFTDVSVNDWFYTYVAQAASYGWIGGYADGSFGPNDLITRAQVTTIVNNMLGREADRSYVNTHTDTLVQFYDLTRIHWAYYDIMEAVNEHEYTRTYGTEDWVE